MGLLALKGIDDFLRRPCFAVHCAQEASKDRVPTACGYLLISLIRLAHLATSTLSLAAWYKASRREHPNLNCEGRVLSKSSPLITAVCKTSGESALVGCLRRSTATPPPCIRSSDGIRFRPAPWGLYLGKVYVV